MVLHSDKISVICCDRRNELKLILTDNFSIHWFRYWTYTDLQVQWSPSAPPPDPDPQIENLYPQSGASVLDWPEKMQTEPIIIIKIKLLLLKYFFFAIIFIVNLKAMSMPFVHIFSIAVQLSYNKTIQILWIHVSDWKYPKIL